MTTATLEKKATRVVATRAVALTAQSNPNFNAELQASLRKFTANDWGICSENDKAQNDLDPASAMGNYPIDHGSETKLWIKRDDYGDYFVITALYPSDY